MTENKFDSASDYRHAVQASLRTARSNFPLPRTQYDDEVRSIFSAPVELLKGQPGLDKATQQERFEEARALVKDGAARLTEALATARIEALAMIDAREDLAWDALAEAEVLLNEAKAYAEARDFEAHQQSKA